MKDLHDDLKAAGCQLDSHESDLYVRESAKARAIMAEHRAAGAKLNASNFVSNGASWIELPFAYSPWWRARQRA